MSTTSELMSTTSRTGGRCSSIPTSGGYSVAQLMEQPTMTVLELTKVFGISKDAGYKFVREGRIRSLRIGSRIVVPTAAVRELLGETPSK